MSLGPVQLISQLYDFLCPANVAIPSITIIFGKYNYNYMIYLTSKIIVSFEGLFRWLSFIIFIRYFKSYPRGHDICEEIPAISLFRSPCPIWNYSQSLGICMSLKHLLYPSVSIELSLYFLSVSFLRAQHDVVIQEMSSALDSRIFIWKILNTGC